VLLANLSPSSRILQVSSVQFGWAK